MPRAVPKIEWISTKKSESVQPIEQNIVKEQQEVKQHEVTNRNKPRVTTVKLDSDFTQIQQQDKKDEPFDMNKYISEKLSSSNPNPSNKPKNNLQYDYQNDPDSIDNDIGDLIKETTTNRKRVRKFDFESRPIFSNFLTNPYILGIGFVVTVIIPNLL